MFNEVDKGSRRGDLHQRASYECFHAESKEIIEKRTNGKVNFERFAEILRKSVQESTLRFSSCCNLLETVVRTHFT